jgi:hypothetical protein
MTPSPQESARISEVDIGRHSRALGILRWSDYALVVTCGMYALTLIADLLIRGSDEDALVTLFQCVAIAILGFGAYTGWRHVGVIDPSVWRLHLAALPLVGLLAAFITWASVVNVQSVGTESTFMQFVQLIGAVLVLVPVALLVVMALGSVLVLRRILIKPFGIKLATLLENTTARAGERADAAIKLPRLNVRRGSFYAIAGCVILLGLLLVRVLVADEETLQRISQDRLLSAILKQESTFQFLAFFLFIRARRFFQVSADDLMTVDKRPPILFLRSFADDEQERYLAAGYSKRSLLDISLESRLANHFFRFGPFVAIGSPKESIPQLGAARVMLPDDQWHERVLAWMRDAAVVVMYGGKTAWVNWELSQILKTGSATRLILLIPEIKGWRRARRDADLRERMEQIRTVFQGSPWHEELTEWNDLADLRAMVFIADGSVVAIRSKSRSRDSYHLAALIAHFVMLEGRALPQEERSTMSVLYAPDAGSARMARS